MKKQFKLFSVLFAAAAMMASCSNDEPANPYAPEGEDGNYSDSYVAFSLQMPTSIGGRADYDKGKYTDGEKEESLVDNLFFFFFDADNKVVDIQKVNKPTFTDDPNIVENPYVTSYGVQEIRLKSGVDYQKVAVVLNSTLKQAADYLTEITNLRALETRVSDYADQVESDGSNQVMSNSVYFDMKDATVRPEADKKVILVDITEKNKYTYEEKQQITGDQIVPAGKKVVDIYVERVVARIDVNAKETLDEYTVDNGNNIITVFNNVNLTTNKVTVEPVIKGLTLTVLAPEARLIKPITYNQVGYGFNISEPTGYKNFQWNDPANKRCYWATTTQYSGLPMTYYSWNDVAGGETGKAMHVEGGALQKFRQYINPNTLNYQPGAANEDNASLNTKVMIVAQLQGTWVEKDEDGNDVTKTGALDFVRYGAEYMFADNLLAQTANLANIDVRNINWDMLSKDYTATEIQVLKVAVNNSFVNGLDGNKFKLVVAKDEHAYNAAVAKVDGFAYDITVDKTLFDNVNDDDVQALLADDAALTALFNKAKEKTVTPVIEAAVAKVNKENILYWKDGMTYFYTTIKHHGFTGLAGGGADNYFNAVVRNHIYDITIEGIYGLGTPVIEPGQPIDPERPADEKPSYIKARINILPWRVVKQNATLH